jgi:hypothetical protein
MKTNRFNVMTSSFVLSCALCAALPGQAQVDTSGATSTANNAVNTTGQVAGQLPRTVNSVGNTAGNLVGSLQPTLQPVAQGVGGALDNLTQPQTISSLLEFLAGVIPNHIEAHVNLDSLRVDKLTVDVRGVDLRNLRVDLLVANSRNAGTVRPALPAAGSTSRSGSTDTGSGTQPSGTQGSGQYNSRATLPGDTPIAGSSNRTP